MMTQYVTGTVIRALREKNNLTQLQLAEKLSISDKTVSKWETGNGYPDISLLEPIADALFVSVAELLSGYTVDNRNISANMMKSKFYICPVCGNIIYSTGEAVVHCHGVLLKPSLAEQTDSHHKIFIERVEDDYYLQIEHPMTKQHYISFIAALSADRIQVLKLYPEGNAEGRFPLNSSRFLFFCNQDGLFYIDPVKGIDDKESSYDNYSERKSLEEAARRLFG